MATVHMMPAGADPQRVSAAPVSMPQADALLVRRFEYWAAQTPDAPALTFQSRTLNYQQLNTQANRIAHALLRAGVARGEFVGVCLEPSPELPAALLGVIKAGAAWVPLDPALPRERLQSIIAQAAPRYIVTARASAEKSLRAGAATLLLDDVLAESLAGAAAGNPAVTLHAEDLCYVMFTSGSTGVPNGVVVTHGNVAGLFANVQDVFAFQPADSWSALHSFAFGFSVWEMFGPLTTGARLVIVPQAMRNDPAAWVPLLLEQQVSVLSITPSAFRQWLASGQLPEAAALARLRLIVFSGEAVRPDDLERWFARCGTAGPQLVNTYALTETAGRVAVLVYAADDLGVPGSIGAAAADAQLQVVDPATLQPVPPGAVGELLIAGPMVARGYVGNPALTAQRFIECVAGDGRMLRAYRSGDRARQNPDGTFSFVGRRDDQVKLRGHRIELQDIEQALRRNPAVADVAVAVDDSGPAPQLVAWIVPAVSDTLELWPSLGEYQVYDPLLYDFMSADEVRVASYRRAFERQVKDKIVLDIGTGKDAVLARLCAAAGARKVYAVEVLEDACTAARALIDELGLSDRVIVLHGDMQTIELPDAIEVCTQGIVGNIGSSDGIAPIWNSVRRLFAPGCVPIPARCTTLIAPAQLPDSVRESPAFGPLAARYAERIFAEAGAPFDVRLCVRNFPRTGLLAQPAVFEELDFGGALPTEYVGNAVFTVTQPGLFDGLLLWTRLQTCADEAVDFLQHQQAWLPVWLPVADQPVAVNTGDRVELRWQCATPAGQIFPDYAVEAVIVAADGTQLSPSLQHRSAHFSDDHCSTELHRRLFAVPPAGDVLAGLQRWAAEQLPAYMLPTQWEQVATLPLNSSGKLDRRALLQRSLAARAAAPAIAAHYADPLEAAVAELWCRVLGRAAIGHDEEFFTAGGDSILAVRLTTEVQRWLDDAVFLAALFDAPTVPAYAEWLRTHHAPAVARRLAQAIDSGPAVPAGAEAPVPATGNVPLSSPQRSLWLLQQLYPDSTAANEQFLIRISGGAEPVQLRRAWHAVLAAHDILRTEFAGRADEPYQRCVSLAECVARDTTPLVDLCALLPAEADARLRSDATTDIATRFDLTAAPLLRTRLYQLPSAELVLLVTAHHSIADGLCVELIRDALAAAYASGSVPRPALQYADFAVRQVQQLAEVANAGELGWWQEQLAGHDGQLLAGNPCVAGPAGHERRIEFTIPRALAGKLRALARAENATLFMLLLAAWRAWLQRCFANDDLLIGAPVTLRRDTATAAMLGCLVNNVVFRNRGSAQRPFRELLRAERAAALAAVEHSTVPFDKIVEVMQPQRTLGRHPLFQVLFMFEDRAAAPAVAGELRFSSDVLPVERASYWDLELSVTDSGAGNDLPAFIGVRTDLHDADALATWPEGFMAALDALTAHPDTAVAALPLLSPALRQQVLQDWNATQMLLAPDATLHGLVAAQALRTPARIAVTDATETLSYAQLHERAGRYAAVLAANGLARGARVALSVARSADAVAVLLAILQRGACWLPLDPAYPHARLALMLEDAQPELLITDGSATFASAVAALSVADLHAQAAEPHLHAIAPVAGTAMDPAYILFTSGSTGRPKGALSLHAGAVSRCVWMWREFGFTEDAVFAQRTSFNFVDSVWEIFGPLLHGARVVVLPVACEHDPAAQLHWLELQQVTHLVTVPVLLDALLTASATSGVPRTLRSVISSGEALPPALVRRFVACWPDVGLINTYGTSETWDASVHRVTPRDADARAVPIGRPVANAALYVLDAHRQPLPVGAVGELHVGGLALAREYVANPELTRERFVQNSFAAEPSSRLYRTGDLAYCRIDGTFMLAGRADRQIKLRGLRIEAGDIESRAREFTGVRQCAVRLQQPAAGEPWLALYVAADSDFDTHALRAHLQASLPRALVPADICVLDALPLTPSGKVDLQALPDSLAPAPAAYVAPRDAVEEQLAAIWAVALGKDRVGVHDDFFALRGHSLLAVQVIARVCDAFAVELPLQALFETPTVAGLARSVEALRWTREDTVDYGTDGAREVLRL